MLEEAATLAAQKGEIETKQQLIRAFKEHFVISEEDRLLVTSSTGPLDERFFSVMDRLKQLAKECEILLAAEDQTLGSEVMQQTSRLLDAAFEKLYSRVQTEFKMLDLEDAQIGGPIRKALRVLAARPSLFERCLQFFAEAREQTLSDAFRAALTEGRRNDSGTGSSSDPIELQSHDLPRYLGDMLAWAHSAAVSEKEALEVLFVGDSEEIAEGIKQGRKVEQWSQWQQYDNEVDSSDGDGGGERTFDGQKVLRDLVNRNLHGVAGILKQRVEIGVRSTEEAVTVYRAMNLLHFYEGIFGRLLGTLCPMQNLVTELVTSSWSHLERLLEDQATELAQEDVVDDMKTPDFLAEAIEQFKSFMNAKADQTEDERSLLFSLALAPYLQHCSVVEERASISRPSSDFARAPQLFQLNCFLAVVSQLRPVLPEDSSILSGPQSRISEIREALVSSQHRFLLVRSGVDQIYDVALTVNAPDAGSIDAETGAAVNITTATITKKDTVRTPLPPPSPDLLTALAAQLDAFLPTAQIDMLDDNLAPVTDRLFAQDVVREAAERFCRDFEVVQAALEVWEKNRNGKTAGGEKRRQEGGAEGEDENSEEDDEDDDEDDESRKEGESEAESEEEEEEEGGSNLRDLYPRTTEEVRLLLT